MPWATPDYRPIDLVPKPSQFSLILTIGTVGVGLLALIEDLFIVVYLRAKWYIAPYSIQR